MGKLDSILLLGALALAGCSGAPSSSADEMLGEANLAVTNAPADAGCLRVNVVGSRTVTRMLDLMPGQTTVFNLNGLPLGTDTFQGDAFASGCGAVTPMSVANWTSDPTTATLAAGTAADVTIVLRRNGTAVVSADFQDDPPSCVPAGGPCMSASNCCSGNSCVMGVCGTLTLCITPQQPCMTPMGTVCVDVSSNVANCGSCGTSCPNGPNGAPTCVMGACSLTCNPGFQNCNGNPADGCESQRFSDPANCGACGLVCPPMFACVMGACVAPPPGAPQIQVPPSINFMFTPIGGNLSFTLQIQNTGSGPLQVTATIIGGPNAADFHITPLAPFPSIPPGGNFPTIVSFNPLMGMGGNRQGFLNIQSNDPMRPNVQVQLNGTTM